MNATGSGQRMQGHFNKTSMYRGKRQYDHHTKLKEIQERFTLGQKMNYQKPTDLKSIKFRILQLQNFME